MRDEAYIGEEDYMRLSDAGIQAESFRPGVTNLDDMSLAGEENWPIAQIGEPGPLLLLGAPGVGKGTQADTLATLWGVPKISTGDTLRTNVANGTKLGTEAEKIMKLGGLVPDQIMTEMVADRLGHNDTAAGFILDGFPRNVRQAQWLDRYLAAHPRRTVLGVVSMLIDLERNVERVIHRRVCPLCKSVYNTQLMPPKRIGRCDLDNSGLEQRSDDHFEVFQTRLAVFKRETEPLIRYYRGRRRFIEVDADKPPSIVTGDIVAGLTGFRVRIGR